MLNCKPMQQKILQLTRHNLLQEYKAVTASNLRFKHFGGWRNEFEDSDIVLFIDVLGQATVLKDRFRCYVDLEAKESTEIQQGSYIVVPKLNGSYEANVLKVTAIRDKHIVAVNAYNNYDVFFFSLSELKEIGYIAFEAGSDVASLTLANE